jgi:hypothetical protein
MPRYDGSGPEGKGPFGRGLGPCSREDLPRNRGGLFLRRGWRGGVRGFRWFTNQSAGQMSDLEAQKNWLENQLKTVKKQIGKTSND